MSGEDTGRGKNTTAPRASELAHSLPVKIFSRELKKETPLPEFDARPSREFDLFPLAPMPEPGEQQAL